MGTLGRWLRPLSAPLVALALLAACGGPHDAPVLFLPTSLPRAASPTAGQSPGVATPIISPPAATPQAPRASPTTPTSVSLPAPAASPPPVTPSAGPSAAASVASSACAAGRAAPRAGTRNVIDEDMAQAAALVGPRYFQDLPQLVARLEAAARAYVEGVTPIPALVHDAAARTELATLLHVHATPSSPPPTVDAAQVGKGVPILLVSYGSPRAGGLAGLPLLALACQGGQLRVFAVDPQFLGEPKGPLDFRMRFVQAADLAGDGEQELLVTATHQGGSGFSVTVGVLGWDGRRLAPRFAASVPHWQAGQADWRLAPHGKGQDLVLDCPALGPFDLKLLAHPTLTRTYRAAGGGLALASVALAPPTFQRDAFNRGEVAFRAGEYATAVARYRLVVDDTALRQDPGAPTNWPGLAWLRIGQSQALLGREADATVSLAHAVQAGGSVGALAQTFRTALGQPDGLARAFAALPGSASAQRLFTSPNPPRDLGFAVDAPGLLQPGLAVSAYMTAHAEAASMPAADLRARLTALGLPVRDLARADLDGDGRAEVIALLPAGATVSGWVATRQGAGPWRALPVGGPQSLTKIGAPRPRPGGSGALLPLRLSGGAQPPETLVSLDHGELRYFTADGTPWSPDAGDATGGCTLADGLGGAAPGGAPAS